MSERSTIEAAVERILYPILKLLIDCGVTEAHFAKVARRTFVKVAAQKLESEVKDQKARADEQEQMLREQGASDEAIEQARARIIYTPRVTNTRISMLTGVPRKDVPSLLSESIEDVGDDQWYRHRCGKVLSDWWRTAEYTDQRGKPVDLIESEESADAIGVQVSFESLVRRGGQDLSHHALLDELLSTKSVERTTDGKIKVLSQRYERMGVGPQALTIAADKIYSLAETVNAKIRQSDGAVEEDMVFTLRAGEQQSAAVLLNGLRRMTKTFLSSAQTKLKQYEAKEGEDSNAIRIGVGAYVIKGDEMRESEYFAKSIAENKKVSNE